MKRLARRGRGVKRKQVISGRWAPWGKITDLACCKCGYRHLVEVKVDKRGRVWMRWTEI
jgi:hypothetical protein